MTNKPNYKTRIHAAQTLSKYCDLNLISNDILIHHIWEGLMKSFENLNEMMNSYSEQKFVPSLERSIIELWQNTAKQTNKDT
jgi:hypothetical protein